MKRIALPILLLAQLAACGPSDLAIKAVPRDVTKVQAELDDLQCASDSKYRGPLILQPFYQSSSEEKYRACMTRRGYTVSDD